jgi:hypothetical protein
VFALREKAKSNDVDVTTLFTLFITVYMAIGGLAAWRQAASRILASQ